MDPRRDRRAAEDRRPSAPEAEAAERRAAAAALQARSRDGQEAARREHPLLGVPAALPRAEAEAPRLARPRRPPLQELTEGNRPCRALGFRCRCDSRGALLSGASRTRASGRPDRRSGQRRCRSRSGRIGSRW